MTDLPPEPPDSREDDEPRRPGERRRLRSPMLWTENPWPESAEPLTGDEVAERLREARAWKQRQADGDEGAD